MTRIPLPNRTNRRSICQQPSFQGGEERKDEVMNNGKPYGYDSPRLWQRTRRWFSNYQNQKFGSLTSNSFLPLQIRTWHSNGLSLVTLKYISKFGRRCPVVIMSKSCRRQVWSMKKLHTLYYGLYWPPSFFFVMCVMIVTSFPLGWYIKIFDLEIYFSYDFLLFTLWQHWTPSPPLFFTVIT